MRTTVDVDDSLLTEAKVVAARTGRTVSAVVNDALRASLARALGEQASHVAVLPTDGAGGQLPGIDLDNREALADRLGENDQLGLDAPA